MSSELFDAIMAGWDLSTDLNTLKINPQTQELINKINKERDQNKEMQEYIHELLMCFTSGNEAEDM